MYHLPEHVQQHVDFVTPSVHFDTKLTRRSGDQGAAQARGIGHPGIGIATPETGGTVSGVNGELDECNEYITPICLRTLYDLFYTPVATNKNSYGIGQSTFPQNVPNLSSCTICMFCSGAYTSGISAERSTDVCQKLLDGPYWKGALPSFDRWRQGLIFARGIRGH